MNRTRRRLLASAGGTLLSLALAGCSSSPESSGTTSPTTGGATGATSTSASASAGAGGSGGAGVITIQNFAFQPTTLTVAPGTTITVVNKDSTAHTVTDTASPAAFDTGDIAAGATVTFTAPSKAGSYSYDCTIHPFMHGTLTVK